MRQPNSIASARRDHQADSQAPAPVSSQPPRFSARTAILSDPGLLDGPKALYLYLDDLSRGRPSVTAKQAYLGTVLNITRQTVRNRLDILEKSGYLKVTRMQACSLFTFGWGFTSDVKPVLHQMSNGVSIPSLLKKQDIQEPPYPLTKRKTCEWCRGAGQRPGAVRGSCPGCGGTGSR